LNGGSVHPASIVFIPSLHEIHEMNTKWRGIFAGPHVLSMGSQVILWISVKCFYWGLEIERISFFIFSSIPINLALNEAHVTVKLSL
jgi:hypothetical protein